MSARLALAACLSLSAALPLAAEVRWEPGGRPPSGALAAGEFLSKKVYICRGRLADGIHPGWFEDGACLVPQKGKVERAEGLEFAVGGPVRWRPAIEGKPVIAGRQNNRVDLLVCRHRTAGGVRVGKAYPSGPHAGHCYVSVEGREVDLVRDFEVLHLK